MLLLRYGPLGQQPDSVRPAEFSTVEATAAVGLEPPPVRGFDRKFLLRHGVHPIVSPAAHEALRTLQIPLSPGAASFDRTQERLREGSWPAPAEVRVEDFLAALDYRFPAPPFGQLGVTLSGGPSAFGQPLPGIGPASLLQIGVQAGEIPFRRIPATHLVIGLDASATMQAGGRFEAARRAIQWLAGRLGDHDRLSLVAFRDDEVVALEGVGRKDLGQLLFALERLEPRGGANLGAGAQESLSLAMRNELDERLVARVALITAGGGVLLEPSYSGLLDLAEEAARQDVALVILDAGKTPGADPRLSRLAAAAEGELRSAASADELRFALAESLTGVSSIVAADAKLKVTFNPRTVGAYRLLGHEANAVAGVVPPPLLADLRRGQTATALFELWLTPGSEDEVAQVDVEWRDPGTGERRAARQTIGRLQFATLLEHSPLPLQQAAFAAETAEVLRESYFVQARPRSLQHVIDASPAVAYELSRRTDFRRFMAFVKELDKVRGRRSE
jgi:Ca-activated chloride channel family protein